MPGLETGSKYEGGEGGGEEEEEEGRGWKMQVRISPRVEIELMG